VFTALCVYSVNGVGWVPDERLLAKTLEHFGTTEVMVWGFDRPLRWDDEGEPTPVTACSRATIEEAIRRSRAPQYCTAILFLTCHEWSRRIRGQLQDAPGVQTYEHFAPYCVSVVLGPQAIATPDQKSTAIEYSFAIRLGGEGMPRDLIAYKRVALANECVGALIAFLREATGMEWDIAFDCSYSEGRHRMLSTESFPPTALPRRGRRLAGKFR